MNNLRGAGERLTVLFRTEIPPSPRANGIWSKADYHSARCPATATPCNTRYGFPWKEQRAGSDAV